VRKNGTTTRTTRPSPLRSGDWNSLSSSPESGPAPAGRAPTAPQQRPRLNSRARSDHCPDHPRARLGSVSKIAPQIERRLECHAMMRADTRTASIVVGCLAGWPAGCDCFARDACFTCNSAGNSRWLPVTSPPIERGPRTAYVSRETRRGWATTRGSHAAHEDGTRSSNAPRRHWYRLGTQLHHVRTETRGSVALPSLRQRPAEPSAINSHTSAGVRRRAPGERPFDGAPQ
jgi:hypothetical protein